MQGAKCKGAFRERGRTRFGGVSLWVALSAFGIGGAAFVAPASASGSLTVGPAATGPAATGPAATSDPVRSQRPLTDPFPNGEVTIDGHGWGPGIGMGQWGAFGYAAVEHESYSWILSHYYGGTTLASEATDPPITVAIIENDGAPVTVTSPSPFSFGGMSFAGGTVVRALLTAAGWQLRTASSCTAARFSFVAKGLTNPVAIPANTRLDATDAEMLTLCRADGMAPTYRGKIEAYDDAGAERTINILPIGQYVADVVPSESSSGWGEFGGVGPQDQQWGFQELEAQAVAARTYALAYEADGGWSSGYADICDSDYCQSYPGIANESLVSTEAARATARQYLEMDGAPAQIEYSASTGGYTVGGNFPPVVDAGDSVCLQTSGWTCNPDHTWTTQVTVAAVEAQFPSIGTLESITPTARNGLGEWGGRVLTIEITGSAGSVTESGDLFQTQFALMSDWFNIDTSTSSSSGLSRQTVARSLGSHLGEPTGPLPAARPLRVFKSPSRMS